MPSIATIIRRGYDAFVSCDPAVLLGYPGGAKNGGEYLDLVE
jgi:hypothetical protein